MTTYIVKKPLEHDGKAYKPGDSIELAEENAVYLLGKGAVGAIEQTEELDHETGEDQP